MAWHPFGEVLASASYDDTIRLWTSDGDEWTCAQTLGGGCDATRSAQSRRHSQAFMRVLDSFCVQALCVASPCDVTYAACCLQAPAAWGIAQLSGP